MQLSRYTPLDPLTSLGVPGEDGIHEAQATMTIACSPELLYALWRDLNLVPKWQERIVRVVDLGEGRSSWAMRLTDDRELEWTSFFTVEDPALRMAWKSEDDLGEQTEIQLAGQVIFEPALNGRGTVVRLTQQFRLPGGKFASFFTAPHLRSPEAYVRENLRHFKQLAETGEVARTHGQSHGESSMRGNIQSILLGEKNDVGERTTAA
jgi:uncharacterized membrane protein